MCDAFADSGQSFIVVADDVDKEYIHSDIASLGVITLVDAS
jgi:hypothetical protein